jgi:hypothetical protein
VNLQVRSDQLGEVLYGRLSVIESAGEYSDNPAGVLNDRHEGHVLEGSLAVSVAVRQRRSELNAIQSSGVVGRCPLRVSDRMARSHDVHAIGAKHRFLSEAVVMDHLALEQPRDRLQPHVRMGCCVVP